MKNIALVTGGSRGLGRAIAIQLAKDGYDIWLNYSTNHSAAQDVKQEIEKIGKECKLLPFNVGEKEEVRKVLDHEISQLDKENERVAALVNNAGITRDNLFYWMNDESWEDVINTNLNSFFYVTKPVVEHMFSKKHGYIVNIGSLAGEFGNPGQTNYSASKAGLIAATKSLAKEMARVNVYVNCVTPGLIESDMTSDLKNNKQLMKRIPLSRFGKAQEVADVVSF
ncbi:MAG: 3-oxoacyl-ACP reductase FabG, partial [Spirochaetota bacterium]|nr:3-oxoacyl-ACP reductase FabG [Spirochaetota bacterium]